MRAVLDERNAKAQTRGVTPPSPIQPPTGAHVRRDRRGLDWMRTWLEYLRAACGPPAAKSKYLPVLVTACFVSLELLPLPTAPPDTGIDTSWCAVLNWAHEHRLQFGTDIVFTYGPLGYLITPYFVGGSTTVVMVVNTALSCQVALGLCLLAWRLGLVWRWLLLGSFVLAAGNAEPRTDLALEAGCLSWGLLCMLESGRHGKLCCANFIILLTFAALAKVTYLFVAGFSVFAAGIFLALDDRARWGLATAGGFGAAALFGWVACGQALANLGNFLLNGFSISMNYDQALGLPGLPMLRIGGSALVLCAFGAMLLRVPGAFSQGTLRARWKNLLVVAWTCGLLFVVWKHSVVRLDRSHFMELLSFAPVACLALEAMHAPPGWSQRAGRALAVACSLGAIVLLQFAFLPRGYSLLLEPLRLLGYHERSVLRPAAWRRQLAPDLEALYREAQLPKVRQLLGTASVDVFGSFQAPALFSGLNYRPRPVFQSYAAYSPRLAELNAHFYGSDHAPDYVLFELSALEHHFPSLEDGPALRVLLANYEFVAEENRFLLLKKTANQPSSLRLLREGEVEFAEIIGLGTNANYWLEVAVTASWRGRLRGFLSEPTPIRLSVWTNERNGAKKPARYRAPAPLLGIGFIASPNFVNTRAVADNYRTGAALRPSGYSLETEPGTEELWQPKVRFRLYEIEPKQPK